MAGRLGVLGGRPAGLVHGPRVSAVHQQQLHLARLPRAGGNLQDEQRCSCNYGRTWKSPKLFMSFLFSIVMFSRGTVEILELQ